MGPHYSQSSRENATPSSSTSPLASYKEVPPPDVNRVRCDCERKIICVKPKQLWVFLTEVLPGKSLGWQQSQDSQHVRIEKYFSIIMPETAKLVKRMSTKKGAGGVLPYMGFIGMCRCEENGFQAVYSRIEYINRNVWV